MKCFTMAWSLWTLRVWLKVKKAAARLLLFTECLKLHSKCGHLKKPMDVVRYLEDELSKVESKLINFPELKLSEADKVSLILQAISADARQYVVLHGHSND